MNDFGYRVIKTPSDIIKSESALTNNAETSVSVGDKTLNRAINVEYIVIRGSGYRKGNFEILYDGSTLYQSNDQFITNGQANVNSSAVVFNVDFNSIDTDLIDIEVVLNDDVAATLKLEIYKINI